MTSHQLVLPGFQGYISEIILYFKPLAHFSQYHVVETHMLLPVAIFCPLSSVYGIPLYKKVTLKNKILSIVYGHLYYFQFAGVINNASMNILVCPLLHICMISFLFHPGV